MLHAYWLAGADVINSIDTEICYGMTKYFIKCVLAAMKLDTQNVILITQLWKTSIPLTFIFQIMILGHFIQHCTFTQAQLSPSVLTHKYQPPEHS